MKNRISVWLRGAALRLKSISKPLAAVIVAGCLLLIVAAVCLLPMGTRAHTAYILIDQDDNIDSVKQKVRQTISPWQMAGFSLASRLFGYRKRIRPGRYRAKPAVCALALVHEMAAHRQTPIDLTLPQAWTKEDLAGKVCAKMMMDSAALVAAMNDAELCDSLGALDTATIATILIPNTYQLYWTASPRDFLKRMYRESLAFWNEGRLKQADALGLSKEEVYTLASIVDAETTDENEKPMVAGMYLNRLDRDMPLQADPTIKFALHRFDLHRIYGDMLRVDSPYNTYTHRGLPPGPIRIPAVSSIEAVLHPARHDYLYMCAKADLSGTHVFSRTYAEHQQAAATYAEALNRRGIH